ncbi:protein D3-like [Eupeodes corollae]|uniref:protein D3-like n=1 Tax=Eupeodes corollae TaxID=290404 RepID=UPI002493B75F|nr:protein D3-like [Eupeodes corollae]
MKLLYLVGIVAVVTVGLVEAGDSDVTKFLKHLEVIPDVIPEGQGASDFLKVSYDSGVFADKGVEVTPTQVKNQPKVQWKAQKNAFYTLILTDPDAPSRAEPKMREFQHWLVVNIPGDDISAGEVLTEYVGSGPPKDSGLHRYVFLLYKQPKKLQFDEKHISKNSAEGRPNFSATKFAAKYKLGAPQAANFYQAQYDDYVKTIHEQLGL